MVWPFGVPRRVAAGVVAWVSTNPLAVVGAVLALGAGGRLYGLVLAAGGVTGPSLDGVVPAVVLGVALAHPAYLVAVVGGFLALILLRS